MNDDQHAQPLTEGAWAMMSDKFIEPIPTHPLTGFELDNIEGRWSRYVALRDPDSMETSVHDVPDLLAEVDRLRAELHEAHRTVSAEEGRAAALEAVYRQTCTERDVRSAEIERLRAENVMHRMSRGVAVGDAYNKHTSDQAARIAELESQLQDYHKSADAHVAKFDRQHERLMEAEERITAARKALFDDAFEGHAQRYRALARALGDNDE